MDPIKRYYGVYRGVVKDNKDPQKQRRLKISITQTTGSEVTDWAWPMEPSSINTDVPVVGQGVWVTFIGGDPDYPVWSGAFGKNQGKNKKMFIKPLDDKTSLTGITDVIKITSKTDGTKDLDLTDTIIAIAQKEKSLQTTLNNLQTTVANIVQGTGVQGATGAQGTRGTQGVQGTQGTTGTGTQGTAGSQGANGTAGATGAVGSQGTQGATGAGTQGTQGTTGTQGTDGTQGTTGAGVQGAQGTLGSNGIQGTQGTTGAGTQGTQGASGSNGAQGTQGSIGEGTQGTQGTQGTSGSSGTQGTQGSVGTTGSQGTDGVQGTQGSLGNTGSQGTQGTTGEGTQGTQGTQGTAIQGTQGTQGITGSTGAGGTIANYGSFYSSSDQPLSVINTQQVLTFNGNYGSNGISIVDSSKITISTPGTYSMTFVAQVSNTANSVEEATFWLKLNGNDYPNSAATITIFPRKSSDEPSRQLVPLTFVGTSTSVNDYVQIYWHGTNTSLSLIHDAAGTSPVHPVTPSVILGITQVTYQGIQGVQGSSGTQGTVGAQGTVGSQGSIGSQGSTGSQGTIGTQGSQGTQGTQGTQGIQGTVGVGTQGVQGTVGSQGTLGSQGTQGTIGATPTAPLTLSYSATVADPLTLTSGNQHGGSSYAGLMTLQSTISGATNPKKFVRMNSTGGLEIIDNSYSTTILSLSDSGALGTSGTITPGAYTAGQHIKTTIWSASDMSFTSTYTQSTATYSTIASKTYTPASSSSYLFVEVYARYYVNGAAEDSFFSQLTWNGIEFAAQRQYWANGSGGGTRSSTLFPLAGRITIASPTGYTLAVNARRDSADDTLSVYADGAFCVKITEIAR